MFRVIVRISSRKYTNGIFINDDNGMPRKPIRRAKKYAVLRQKPLALRVMGLKRYKGVDQMKGVIRST